jgi:hypothetical protein
VDSGGGSRRRNQSRARFLRGYRVIASPMRAARGAKKKKTADDGTRDGAYARCGPALGKDDDAQEELDEVEQWSQMGMVEQVRAGSRNKT